MSIQQRKLCECFFFDFFYIFFKNPNIWYFQIGRYSEREQQLANVEKELAGAKGIFKAKQRKELHEQAEQLQTQIANMKQYLSSIVQGYGYKNVKEFLAEYKASKAEYTDYQSAVAEWEKLTGNKAEADSMKARLQRKQQEVKERENNRQNHQYKKDRGGR